MFGAETGHTLNKMAADQSSVDQLSALASHFIRLRMSYI